MTINKLTLPAKDNAIPSKVNDIVDELGNKLENTATGLFSITIDGTATDKRESLNIGYSSIAPSNQATVYGCYSAAGRYGIALGCEASATDDAIQLGKGTNNTAHSFNIGFYNGNTPANYALLDGTTGLIPDARLSTNIARTSQIPTVPTNISSFTNDSGYITGITSTDVTTALGYTPYNSSNPSGYTSNVGTVTSVNNTSPDANGNVTISIPSISNLADKDLGNLSATGQAVIDGKADTSFSNITNTAKIAIAHNAMPSGTYTDLTLSTSGATYTAPSDGWFTIRADGASSNTGARFVNTAGGLCSGWTTGNGGTAAVHANIPAAKGQSVLLEYNDLNTVYWFRFVYALGSESEAS